MSGTSTINFTTIPSNLRNPGVFVELDPTNANTTIQQTRALLVGQITAAGIATPGVPLICSGPADAVLQGGAGSQLALMAAQYCAADPVGEVWYLPLADDPAAVAATGTFAAVGTVSSTGTVAAYIAGQVVNILVPALSTPAVVAADIIAAINAVPTMPVVATGTAANVILTAKNKGLSGNDIDYRLNYYGSRGGESLPLGLTFTGILVGTGTQLTGGTVNPSLAIPLANLTNQTFDYVAFPYTDAGSLTAWQTFENATAGRWAYSQMLYGGAFAAYRGTYSGCTTFGITRNDPAISIMGVFDSPTPMAQWAAEIAANVAVSVRANPALPLQYMPLNVLAPPLANQFTFGECNTLLFDGISTFKVNNAGQVETYRLCTTYQTNAAGAPDNSYLDVETRYTLAYLIRDLVTYLSSIYGRKVLVSNGTRIAGGYGSSVTTAAIIQTSVVNRYRYQESNGLVQNSDLFAQNILSQNVGNGTVKILWPGMIANQLRQIELLFSFTKP